MLLQYRSKQNRNSWSSSSSRMQAPASTSKQHHNKHVEQQQDASTTKHQQATAKPAGPAAERCKHQRATASINSTFAHQAPLHLQENHRYFSPCTHAAAAPAAPASAKNLLLALYAADQRRVHLASKYGRSALCMPINQHLSASPSTVPIYVCSTPSQQISTCFLQGTPRDLPLISRPPSPPLLKN